MYTYYTPAINMYTQIIYACTYIYLNTCTYIHMYIQSLQSGTYIHIITHTLYIPSFIILMVDNIHIANDSSLL